MNNAQHELATNHQRAHSMPAGSFYNNRNQLHQQQKEVGFPIVNTTNKRRHPVNMTDGLVFGLTQNHMPIYQQNQSSLCQVEIRCKVDRGFFLCDQHWTCYRRNYFQLTTAFTTHCNENQVFYINDSGSDDNDKSNNPLVPIEAFYIQLSAITSENSQPVELIQLTAKRDKGPQQKPSMLPIQPGDGLLLQYPHDNSQRTVTYERLQFKSATANNGKKRATQQYFYLTAQLIARDVNHYQHIIASSQSSPLVVRGRSPGHYADTDQRLLHQHHASPLTRSAPKTKRKRNSSRGESSNKENHHQQETQDTTITTTDKDTNAPIPPSPSSLSPIPMSMVPIVDSAATTTTTTTATANTSMPNRNSAPSFIQHGLPSHNHHQQPSSSSISSSSISPSSSPPPPPLTFQSTPAKDMHPSVSSTSTLPLPAHPSSAMITPTIPSDATSSSMLYMNGPPATFNPHGRSFSANDSVWRFQHYTQHPHPPLPPPTPLHNHQHHHHHQQQQQQQQVHDEWSGMSMIAPSWMERQRTDSVATFGSYVAATPDDSVLSSRSSYARAEFPSPPSTATTTNNHSHPLDSQSMPPPPPSSLSTIALSPSNNSNKNTTMDDPQLNKPSDLHNNDPSATTYLIYPNTPWDARQHGHLTDYNQGDNK